MSNLKIFVLAGFQNTGKTTILNRLIRDLRDSGFKRISGVVRELHEKCDDKDGYAFLENGKEKIYIATAGDMLWQVRDNIAEAKKNGATKLVISCHVTTKDSQQEIIIHDSEATIIYKPKYPKKEDSESVFDLYVDRLKSYLL